MSEASSLPGKHFTSEEKEKINKIIFQARMVGATHEETRQIIEKQIGRPLSQAQYYRYRREVLDNDEVTGWITQFAKAGYIAHYRDVIDNLILVRQELMKVFIYECSKPDDEKSVGRISTLARNIRENELSLAGLGFGSPVLLKIKELIDKGDVRVTPEQQQQIVDYYKRYNSTDQEPGENNTENWDTGTDDNRVT